MKARLALFLIAAAFGCASARADELSDVVSPFAEAMYSADTPPAMVIAVVKGEQTFVQGYGEASPRSGLRPDGHSLVRIASLSKLLTSDVLSAMVVEGRVSLVDTLQQYAPPGAVVPAVQEGDPITLLSLATHTGGLPREAAEPRWTWLEANKTLHPPGLYAHYSNVGFDLLSDALGAAAGKPYASLLQAYTTVPLGMADTTPAPNAEQCARMIVGGTPARPCGDQTIMAGAGGVYSTAADMAIWMRYQLGVGAQRDPERRAVAQRIYIDRSALTFAQGLDHAGYAAGIGLAWIRLRPVHWFGPPLIEKTGNIGGFTSYIAMQPERQIGVFVAIARPAKSRHTMYSIIMGVNNLVTALAGGPPPSLPVIISDSSAER